jgi:hypothetical protein
LLSWVPFDEVEALNPAPANSFLSPLLDPRFTRSNNNFWRINRRGERFEPWVVPDAVVELWDTTKGTMQTAKTDGDGVFRFFFVAPGRYALSVSHEGFREESHGVNVLLGPPGTRNITLEVAGGTATVKALSLFASSFGAMP